jgi:membrane protein YdbS with pleckstrin-like domain
MTVLCPPHLVDQWLGELERRFHLHAVAVTAAGASRLEDCLRARASSLHTPTRSSVSTTSRATVEGASSFGRAQSS